MVTHLIAFLAGAAAAAAAVLLPELAARWRAGRGERPLSDRLHGKRGLR